MMDEVDERRERVNADGWMDGREDSQKPGWKK